MDQACRTNGEKRNAYRISVENPDGKRRLGSPRHRWVDNIRMDHRETGWICMDWMDLAQDRDQWRAHVNTIINLRVPYNVGKFLSSYTTGGFSRRAQLHEVSYKKLVYKTMASHNVNKIKRVSHRLQKRTSPPPPKIRIHLP
jgi:hypothetical protein